MLNSIKNSLICVLLMNLLLAQKASLTGLIINDKEQTPIHGADIYLEKFSIGTISQVDGQFLINDIPHDDSNNNFNIYR